MNKIMNKITEHDCRPWGVGKYTFLWIRISYIIMILSVVAMCMPLFGVISGKLLWVIVGAGFVAFGLGEFIIWGFIMILERRGERKDDDEIQYRVEAKKITDKLREEIKELQEEIREIKGNAI